MLDLSSRKVYGALVEQCVGGDAKADKVESAVAGHLAGLDSNGNLTDSGVSPTEEVTVEGNPVTFESPFEQDAKSVVVSVKPIQDLHGYDHPWVGGAGKNKLPLVLADIKANNTSGTWSGNVYSVANGTFEVLTNNGDNVTGIKVNGTFNANALFILAQNVSLSDYSNKLLSGCPSGGASGVFGLSIAQTASPYKSTTTYGNDETIRSDWEDVTNGYIYILVYASNTVSSKTFYPMVRLATESDATFAPYSNICPISGIDELEIGVSGKNILDVSTYTANKYLDASGNEISANSYGISKPIMVNPSTQCVASGVGSVSGTYAAFYDENNHFISSSPESNNTFSFTTPNNAKYVRLTLRNVSSSTPQLEYGSTPTEYEPYVSHTTTIPLSSTLYGGTVDVTDGVDTVTYGYIASYNGETLPGAWISDRDVYTGSNSPTIGAEVAYELATPTTISLTPTDVELLEGTNVVSTNGEKVAVTYGRSLWQDIDELKTDTEGKLDKSDVADVEGDTASRAYSVNEFMFRADGLYKVTAPIAQNASITASNTTKTTVGEVLTALLNA